MKKEAKTAKKTTRKTTKRAAVTKAAPKAAVVKKTAVVKSSIQDTPTWVKIVAVTLIILGYAVYRFWGIAKVNNVTISRVAYYKAMEQQVGKQVLENLIQETLIRQAAVAQNYVVDQKKIDDQVATISAQIAAQGSTIEEALKAENLTMADVRKMYELNIIVENLGRGEVLVTDTEIDKYIADNKDSLPENLTGVELRNMVGSQLENEKANTNISNWLKNLEANAEIVKF